MQARLQNRTYDRHSDRTRTAGARPQHSGELLGEHVETEVEVVIFEPYATIIQQTSNHYQININFELFSSQPILMECVHGCDLGRRELKLRN